MITSDVATIRPAARLRGELRPPGDKSISHRALILATLAAGESRISAAGDGADVRSTAGIMRALGATVEVRPDDDGRNAAYRVVSPGADGLSEPDEILDCGNSGTSLRLIAGMLAGLPLTAILDGDPSLRRRPVARIIEPLRRMGAVLHGRRRDSLPPLTVVGHTPLQGTEHTTPVPSAQVKSAVLLAGLRAEGRTTVREQVATRDHTERMLRARGVVVAVDGGILVPVIHGAQELTLVQLEESLRDVIEKARTRSLTRDDMQGATFTVSNLGMYGIDRFDAILNPPEGAILAVGGSRMVPSDSNGATLQSRIAEFTLTSDHRAIDGAAAARFMTTLKRHIESDVEAADS